MGAKYAHTNLIARDWRRLATFYERVFGCTPASQERDLSGRWIEDATAIDGVHIRVRGRSRRQYHRAAVLGC